jgi:glyoxylase-like metal-dependent hydrolase (beta-lactamase superfamily II)
MLTLITATVLTVLAASLPLDQAQPAPAALTNRAIAPLGDDLYDVRFETQHTIFLVTADSIVLVDPLGVECAQWLQGEFEKRFPGKPVRYVVLTHHHAERASGAGVFRSAVIVGQAEFRRALRENPSSSTPNYRFVAPPRQTFTNQLSIAAGGKTVELVHVGPFHSSEMTVVSFPSARKVFAVEAPPIQKSPFAFGTLNPAEVVTWLSSVARINFDTMLFGDGTTMTRDQIVPLAEYLGHMRADIVREYGRGRSLSRLQDTMRLDAYQSLPHYTARREQIASMYDRLSYVRIDVVFSGLAHYLPENPPDYCNGYASCSSGGAVAGGSLAATVAWGRKFGAQVELFSSDQF